MHIQVVIFPLHVWFCFEAEDLLNNSNEYFPLAPSISFAVCHTFSPCAPISYSLVYRRALDAFGSGEEEGETGDDDDDEWGSSGSHHGPWAPLGPDRAILVVHRKYPPSLLGAKSSPYSSSCTGIRNWNSSAILGEWFLSALPLVEEQVAVSELEGRDATPQKASLHAL